MFFSFLMEGRNEKGTLLHYKKDRQKDIERKADIQTQKYRAASLLKSGVGMVSHWRINGL